MTNVQDQFLNAKRIVIKIGTALLVDKEKDSIKTAWIEALSQDIQDLIKAKKEVVIVSSGGIAMGRSALKIPKTMPPGSIPLQKKQAASAVGQFQVFKAYHEAFEKNEIKTAQVLLTMMETENRLTHLNARETLNMLLSHGIIPVINENDSVSTEEIRFGDNDRLAARVAIMIKADLLVLLSTIDGLYTANPDIDHTAKLIPLIKKVDKTYMDMAGDALPGLSTGGMRSKLEAARMATRTGISMIIANGMKPHALKNLVNKKNIPASLFLGTLNPISARKKWIQGHMKPKGTLTIDEGALKALQAGKSLLPIGVKKIEGKFERGDVVKILANNIEIAQGICNYDVAEAQKIAGFKSEDILKILGYSGPSELIHRNDMVLRDE